METEEAMWLPPWVIVLLVVLFLFYMYGTWTFGTFRSTCIPGPRPWPFIGTLASVFKKGVLETDLENVRTYGKVVGTFEGRTPTLVISDVELLKQIMVKQFSAFQNRRTGGLEEYPMRKALPRLRDHHWKHVRSLLTPTFSAGKLRNMARHIHQCSKTLVRNLREKAMKGENVELKEYCGAFTMDVIACTAFGLDIDSQNNKHDPFVYNAAKFFTHRVGTSITLFLLLCPFAPWILTKLGVNLFPMDASKFFVDIVNRTIEERRSQQNGYVDFLQLMMDLRTSDPEQHSTCGDTVSSCDVLNGLNRDKERKGLTHEEILAQSLLFFLAGYETTATTLSFAAYCLALNQGCQSRLIKEIDSVMKDVEQEYPDNDQLNSMPYLDMCVCEALRMFPPATRINRICAVDTQLGDTTVSKGTVIIIPIYAIHHDPDVWHSPGEFIPERFTKDEKSKRDPVSWMPFGHGPRHCIGTRLAFMEIKMVLVHLLRNFLFEVCEQTQIPLKWKKYGLLQPQSGIVLRLRPRFVDNDKTFNKSDYVEETALSS